MTTQTTISLLSRHQLRSALRQSEDGVGRFGNVQVELELHDHSQWLAVYDNIGEALEVRIPRARRALFVSEPPGIKTYSAAFANQFGTLISPVAIPGYKGRWLQTQSSLPWFYGVEFVSATEVISRLNLADLRKMTCPSGKLPRISVVCSKKSQLPRHRQRLALLDHLSTAFPGQIDIFGNGFQPVADKAVAIAPYRYHLVLENTDEAHFWTEKSADAYLGFALPLFSGCANIGDYFAEGSFIHLPDIEDVTAITAKVAEVLQTDPFAARLAAITTARTLVLERYNLMAALAELASDTNASLSGSLSQPFLLRPARDFEGLSGWWRARRPLAS
jgi:Glycosyltransferase family 10 (fucosyltransferase) C-term